VQVHFEYPRFLQQQVRAIGFWLHVLSQAATATLSATGIINAANTANRKNTCINFMSVECAEPADGKIL